MKTIQTNTSAMLELYLYYGMKTVGKLFLSTGIVFLLALWIVLSETAASEERSFLMLFVAVSAMFACGGGLMLIVSRFMQKPEVSENAPAIHVAARTVRWFLGVALFMIVSSIIPLTALFFFLVDTRDWLPWQDVPETGTLQACEETNIQSRELSWCRCRFVAKTPEGKEISWESYSPKTFDETTGIPLQRYGSLYQAKGCQFGILDFTSGFLLVCMLLSYLIFLIFCIHGFWKLRRF
ncbi:MAG: hypothetical protein Q4D98_00690 [Planctomycetia bacterium]|nr:hypothetical protein [Planctomycetia bacterium]